MKTQNVSITILVKDRAAQEFEKDSKVFIEGRENSEYSIKLENHNDFRVKTVIGIDGVNIIDSSPISEKDDQIGYILDAGQSTIIRGYRLDESNAASFKFTEGKSAYANTVKGMGGKTQGVISARIYREKDDSLEKIKKAMEEWKEQYPKIVKEYVPYPVYPRWPSRPWYDWDKWNTPVYPTWTCKSSDGVAYNASLNLCGSSTDGATQNSINCMTQAENLKSMNSCADFSAVSSIEDNPFKLGSTFGSKVEQKIKEVEFAVGNFLCELVIYYSTREQLEKFGIEFKKVAKISSFPDHKPGKYCQVPSGWTG